MLERNRDDDPVARHDLVWVIYQPYGQPFFIERGRIHLIELNALLFVAQPVFENLEDIAAMGQEAEHRKYLDDEKRRGEEKIDEILPDREENDHQQKEDKGEQGNDRCALDERRRHRVDREVFT